MEQYTFGGEIPQDHSEGIDPFFNRAYWDGKMLLDSAEDKHDWYRRSRKEERVINRMAKQALCAFILPSNNGEFAPISHYDGESVLKADEFTIGNVVLLQEEEFSLDVPWKFEASPYYPELEEHLLNRTYADPLNLPTYESIDEDFMFYTMKELRKWRKGLNDESSAQHDYSYRKGSYAKYFLQPSSQVTIEELPYSVKKDIASLKYKKSRKLFVVTLDPLYDRKIFTEVNAADSVWIQDWNMLSRSVYTGSIMPTITLGAIDTSNNYNEGQGIHRLHRVQSATEYPNKLKRRMSTEYLSSI